MAIALVHHPVLDRRGDVVTSAVTNLDIHDLARLATTYNLSRYYLVTPAAEQQPRVLLATGRKGPEPATTRIAVRLSTAFR